MKLADADPKEAGGFDQSPFLQPGYEDSVATAAQAKLDRETKRAAEADRCLICLGAPVDPIELPCKHSYCRRCLEPLRETGVSQSCPLCRAPLPPGAEQLFDMGDRVWAKIMRAVGSNGEWPVLTSEQQSEMDGAILMLEEAMAQVSDG